MTTENSFFSKVYEVVRSVPEGKVTTYGAIAKYLGSPQSSRMVGWAMNAAHSHPDIPAHRVVNRKGLLTYREAPLWGEQCDEPTPGKRRNQNYPRSNSKLRILFLGSARTTARLLKYFTF